MCPGAPCDAALCHGGAGFSPAPLRSLSTFTRCGLALCGRGLSGGPPAGTARLPGGRCVWPGDHGGAERCRTRAEAEAETSRPPRGQKRRWRLGSRKGPCARAWPRGDTSTSPQRLGLRQVVGPPPAVSSWGTTPQWPGPWLPQRTRREQRRVRASLGGGGRGCTEVERGPRAPEEQPGAPGRPTWRTSLAAGRSCPVPGASAASSPPLGHGQASGRSLGLNRNLGPCRARGRVRLGSRLPPATAHGDPAPRPCPNRSVERRGVARWLSPATSAHVFQTLTRGRSHAAFLTENKSYPILRPKGKQDTRRHAAPESRGHVEREASGTAVSPATTTCGTRGAEGGHGGPAGRGHCG